MVSLGRVALVTVVAVVLLSVGANELASSAPGQRDVANCQRATLYVSEQPNATAEADYADLSDEVRAAFDEVRTGEGRSGAVDPAVGKAFPQAVSYEGTTYGTVVMFSDCPLIAGVPSLFDPAIAALLVVHRIFSGLVLPVGVLLVVVFGYRRLDGWLGYD